jgi:deazaflavin-dependent oxidoreductase (nitroreductase family)
MNTTTRTALEAGGICDITTIGARSGKPHRLEVAFHYLDGEFIVAGRPGFKRDWLANLKANPEFTLHLRNGDDVTGRATEITDQAERDRILFAVRTSSWGVDPKEARATHAHWVATSPLVRFDLVG